MLVPTTERWLPSKRYWLLVGVILPLVNAAIGIVLALAVDPAGSGWPLSSDLTEALAVAGLLVEWALLVAVLARRGEVSVSRVAVTLVVLVGMTLVAFGVVWTPIVYGFGCGLQGGCGS